MPYSDPAGQEQHSRENARRWYHRRKAEDPVGFAAWMLFRDSVDLLRSAICYPEKAP